MKKSLKGQTLVYQIRSKEDSSSVFIGTRHWMLRMQEPSEQIRKDLAQSGLFNEGAINNGSPLDTPPNVENIFPKDIQDHNQLIKTPYLIEIDKILCRVFILPDGTNVLANETYVSEAEAAFQNKTYKTTFDWSTKGPNQPIIYGKRLALVLPMREGNRPQFQLKQLSYAESGSGKF